MSLLTNASNPASFQMWGMSTTQIANAYGVIIGGSVTDPTQIQSDGIGQWIYIQTIGNFEGLQYNGLPSTGSIVTQTGPFTTIDGVPPGAYAGRKFPYTGAYYACGSASYFFADAPGSSGLSNPSLPQQIAVSLQGIFHTYVYYSPPQAPGSTGASIFVPISQFDWGTNLASSPSTLAAAVAVISPASAGSPWTFQNAPGTTVPTAVNPITPLLPTWNSPLPSPGGFKPVGSTGQIQFSWNAVSGSTGYLIKQTGASGNVLGYVTSVPVSGTTYTVGNLTKGQGGYFVVVAVNANGESVNSPVAGPVYAQ